MSLHLTYPVYYLPEVNDTAEALAAEWLGQQLGGRLIRVDQVTPYRDSAMLAAAGQVTLTGARSSHGPTWHGGAVLLPWPTPELLNDIAHDGDRVTAVCVLDNGDGFVQAWLRAHQAMHLVTEEPLQSGVDGLSSIVRVALDDIARPGKLADFIGHLDRGRAISGLQLLHRAGYAFTPEQIAEYVLTEGCRTGFALGLYEYAGQVLKGHKFRLDRPIFDRQVLRLWEQKAETS